MENNNIISITKKDIPYLRFFFTECASRTQLEECMSCSETNMNGGNEPCERLDACRKLSCLSDEEKIESMINYIESL